MITVQFPDSVLPNFFPYWSKDNQTGQLTGYYVDYILAVLKEAGIQNYTLRSHKRYGASYNSLGIFFKSNLYLKVMSLNEFLLVCDRS